jgi:uncharacterized protein YciI
MQFVITAFDGKDSEALTRRMSARPKHLDYVKKAIEEGKHLYGGAILDDDNKMIGSVMIVDYPSKEVLVNEWLNNEPYVLGNVWQEIDIKPFRVADFFHVSPQ